MCFTNYIGVSADCGGDAAPESGLYINQLSGINIYMAGDIADSEFTNGIDLLTKRIAFAVERVKGEASLKMSQYIRSVPALLVDHVGEWSITGVAADDYTAGGATSVGVEICMNQLRYFRMGRIRVTEVEVLQNTTQGAQTLNFTDHLGNVIHTETFATVAGASTIVPVDEEFDTSRIWVNYAPAGISYNDSAMLVKGCKGCGGNSSTFRDYGYARVRGRTGANGSEVYSKNTFGLNIRFEVVCSQEELLCRLKGMDTFKFLMLYAAGVEVANEAIVSDRFNAVTNLRKDDFVALRDEWQDKYDELFRNFSDNIGQTLSKFGDECITCKSARAVSARL